MTPSETRQMKVNRLHKAEKQNKKQMSHTKRGAERSESMSWRGGTRQALAMFQKKSYQPRNRDESPRLIGERNIERLSRISPVALIVAQEQYSMAQGALATAHQQSVPEAGTRGYSSSSARAITRMQRVSTLACMHACITNVSQHPADETPRSISWRDLARISRFSTFQREGPESSEIETVSPQQPWK
ncbi:hypothetical protein CIHG_05275 [Coccidioides immitis H538.4]|uniref:Uncharacterized protein n=3 Tax=Coccidioides immitis TaxID=5501 RepID=A0A0J8R2V9_COCIT|nr:hypothetical protein CIRG_08342 [Coccidioides immitis RMSCC 2394]KMU78660.1 hypothetical protein CISG_01700 [Coccidioides immitis RMSCC 3703]KMU87479.1 hypothetical protein CIHG_05275 [Coccidioides immitis H538.4]